ncbi:MAG TPA: rod shape-determining protein MreD [Gemmatimonadaceae bacterium]|nr:rod shape-determining protein MreD [Gemmatimonadaceae bacterium]
MKSIDVLRIMIAFGLLLVLHYTLRPLLAWRSSPDFLVIALLLVSIRVRPGSAAVVGFITGLFADSISIDGLGAGAMAMSVVAFGASWLKAVFFADNLPLIAFFIFLGKWALDIMYHVVSGNLGGGELAMQLLVWSPLAAAVTALFGLIVLALLRPILRTSPA